MQRLSARFNSTSHSAHQRRSSHCKSSWRWHQKLLLCRIPFGTKAGICSRVHFRWFIGLAFGFSVFTYISGYLNECTWYYLYFYPFVQIIAVQLMMVHTFSFGQLLFLFAGNQDSLVLDDDSFNVVDRLTGTCYVVMWARITSATSNVLHVAWQTHGQAFRQQSFPRNNGVVNLTILLQIQLC